MGLSHYLVLCAILAALVVAGLWEYFTLARARAKVPIRIHVNGTRGKSSLTRLIAAGLREAGIATFAKTTGTLPRMIYPDGRELPVFRAAKANIIEQKRVIGLAAAVQAEAIVLECMALQPLLQALSELKLVRSTHTVITNARPDHLDVMGPGPADVARALSGMICVGGTMFTAEEEHLGILKHAAEDRGAKVVAVNADDAAAVPKSVLAGFSYTEHAENVALALAVFDALKIDREVAIRGMHKASPDPGAMTAHDLDFFGRRLLFYNGFAANDPVSTGRLWHMVLEKNPDFATRIAIFNCRADRTDRSAQLAEALCEWEAPSCVVLMGTGTHVFARFAERRGFDADRIVFAEGMRVEEIFERLVELSGRQALLMGMGNIGGQGLDLTRHFQNRQVLEAAPKTNEKQES